jgi:lipopolysaccharide transport system ATP-binding protein
MTDIAVSVRDVSKRYLVFENQRARLLHALWPASRGGRQEVWALRDIGFEIRRGEAVAVIGRNGSGKSTLLEILTGTLTPTAGAVEVKGRVSALLELGSGFNPEYTGRDNVMLNGLLLGLGRDEIERRFGEIAAFAEIGDAIERPVKTYSDGMRMRLAFAVQALTDPDILVIDEALSVGDFFFQQKCFRRIRALREKGVTLIFVSHDMGTVRDLCGRAIYLRQGRVQFAGETRVAIREYLAEQESVAALPPAGAAEVETAQAGELQAILRDSVWRASPQAAAQTGRIIAVAIYDGEGQPTTSFRMGSAMHLKVAYRSAKEVPTHVTAVIRNKYDQVVTSMGSSRLGLTPPAPGRGEQPGIFEMRMELLLEAGNYSVTATIARLVAPNRGENLDSTDAIGPITIHWDYEKDVAPFLGMFGLGATGTFKEVR